MISHATECRFHSVRACAEDKFVLVAGLRLLKLGTKSVTGTVGWRTLALCLEVSGNVLGIFRVGERVLDLFLIWSDKFIHLMQQYNESAPVSRCAGLALG